MQPWAAHEPLATTHSGVVSGLLDEALMVIPDGKFVDFVDLFLIDNRCASYMANYVLFIDNR